MLRDVISEREKELPYLTIGKILKIAKERKDVASLGPGEPDFVAPPNVIKAAKRALDAGLTHYSPVGGRRDFLEAAARKLKKENRIDAGLENIIATTGSTEGILLSLMSTVDPGEGVLVPDPGFLAYRPAVEVLNGMPLAVPLLEENGFLYDVDQMKRVIVPEKTNVIILNTPSNPTGTVISRKNLEEIAGFANEYELLILADEAYEGMVYDRKKHVSMGSLNGMGDRVVTLQSFSKTFAMPGFRLGYACGPEKIISAMRKLHIFTSLAAPTVSQVAGIEALKGTRKYVDGMMEEYGRRREIVMKRLEEMGIPFVRPGGTFYIFPNISGFKMSSLKFAERLLEEARVAVIPGTEFGRHGEGFIRISYATSVGVIRKAMDRIEGFLEKI